MGTDVIMIGNLLLLADVVCFKSVCSFNYIDSLLCLCGGTSTLFAS
jgi:hypothetical protein